MSKARDEEVRRAWIASVRGESNIWLAHIDRRVSEAADTQRLGRIPILETGEVLYHSFTLLNWLAHIYFREDRYIPESNHPKGRDVTSWLLLVTDWPVEAVEAFWYCVRNPTMHTGHSSVYADYGRKSSSGHKLYGGLSPNLTFDPVEFQTDKLKPRPGDDGYFISESFYRPGGLEVEFYFAGVRRKLDRAVRIVLESIEIADHNSLAGLRKVNMRILPLMYVPEDGEGNSDSSR